MIFALQGFYYKSLGVRKLSCAVPVVACDATARQGSWSWTKWNIGCQVFLQENAENCHRNPNDTAMKAKSICVTSWKVQILALDLPSNFMWVIFLKKLWYLSICKWSIFKDLKTPSTSFSSLGFCDPGAPCKTQHGSKLAWKTRFDWPWRQEGSLPFCGQILGASEVHERSTGDSSLRSSWMSAFCPNGCVSQWLLFADHVSIKIRHRFDWNCLTCRSGLAKPIWRFSF